MSRVRQAMMSFASWLDDRIGLAPVRALAMKKQVPVHKHTVWYYLGGMTLFLFMIQIATGILLLFYYRPSAEGAFESVQFLMAEVQFGWLVRSMHSWAANLMIFTLFLHLFSVMLLRAYAPPRDLTWMSGVILLVLAMTFGFTGYLLPWNELAYFATRVGTQIIAVIPLVGEFMLKVLRGGEDVTGATLTRFYAIHVALLPAATVTLVGLHLLLVQRYGNAVPASVEDAPGPKRSMPFFPNFFLRDLVGWLIALAILGGLAAFIPAELGAKADPFASAPAGIKPEWYFMFMFQTLKYLPAHILIFEGEAVGVMGFGLGALFLFLLPFIDRPRPGGKPSRLFFWIGIGIIVFILVMTYLGYTADPTK
jgi:cytochrome b6